MWLKVDWQTHCGIWHWLQIWLKSVGQAHCGLLHILQIGWIGCTSRGAIGYSIFGSGVKNKVNMVLTGFGGCGFGVVEIPRR